MFRQCCIIDLLNAHEDVEEMCKHKMQTYFVLASKTLSSISSTMIRNLYIERKTARSLVVRM